MSAAGSCPQRRRQEILGSRELDPDRVTAQGGGPGRANGESFSGLRVDGDQTET